MNRIYRHEIFEFDEDKIRSFIELPTIIYRNDPNRLISFKDSEAKYLKANYPIYQKIIHKKFILYMNNSPVARAMGIIHPDINLAGNQTALIGFFECIKDNVCFTKIMEIIENYFKNNHGIKKIIAPINFTTWHTYRFKTFSFNHPTYLFEPYNPAYYPEFFKNYGYQILQSYFSRKLNHQEMQNLVSKNTSAFLNLIKAEITLRPISLNNFDQEIYDFCKISFCDNFLYTPISYDEFYTMYRDGKSLIDPNYFCIAEKNNNLIGFLFCLPDYIDAIRDMKGKQHLWAKLTFLIKKRKVDRLLVKTMAVHPDFRKIGLGKALMYWVHEHALHANYKEAIHALFIADNPSGNYSNCADIFGVYELLHKELT